MLPPAGRLTGNLFTFSNENEPEEVLTSEISRGAVSSFVIETCSLADWPTSTAPNSTVEGVTPRALLAAPVELVDENDFASEPQPERPRFNAIAAIAARATERSAL